MSARDLVTTLPAPVVRALRHGLPTPVRRRLGGPVPAWRVGVGRGSTLAEAIAAPATLVLDDEACAQLDVVLIADPFAVRVDGRWQLYVEVVHGHTGRGRIATLASDDLRRWSWGGIVLDEPFHLSFPCVLEEDGERYLLPESADDGTVRLYRCVGWPDRFELERVLLRGAPYRDAAVVRHEGRWWMFVETSRRATDDRLELLSAARLAGPWTRHPASPIVRGDARSARPAGRPFVVDGQLWRTAQDGAHGYGRGVRGVPIVQLTPDRYRERAWAAPLVVPGGHGWRARGAHHLDVHPVPSGWVVFTDGHP